MDYCRFELEKPVDFLVDKKTDLFIIYDQWHQTISRWSHENISHSEIFSSDIERTDLYKDDRGYLNASNWHLREVIRWNVEGNH